MNLEHVSAGKSPYNPTQRQPKQVQQTLFPKRSLRPAYRVSNEQIERIMRHISAKGLCGRQMVRAYLRRQVRHNCRPNTICSSGSTLRIFLAFFKRCGGRHLSEIDSEHISAFIEHEQDRGIAPVSIDGRLKGLYAFLNFLVRRGVLSQDVTRRKFRIKVPEALPRAIDPEDRVRCNYTPRGFSKNPV